MKYVCMYVCMYVCVSILTSFDLVIVVFFLSHIYFSFLPFISGLTPLVKPPWMPSASAFFISLLLILRTRKLLRISILSFDVLLSFPHPPKFLIRYLAFLTLSGRSYGTIVNCIILAASTLSCQNFAISEIF